MKTYSNISDRYNTKVKVYPSGMVRTVYTNKHIFVHPEDKIPMPSVKVLRNKTFKLSDVKSAPRNDSIRRSKEKLFDLIYCNEWEYFVTVTFDPKKVDSFNAKEVMKKTSKWLSHMVERRGLKYVLIPEKHKSGRIHCHALFSGSLKLVFSGKFDRGKPIYNLPEWPYGFSTAIPVDGDKMRLSCYVTKYIMKGNKHIFGKYYWSSQNLVREPIIYLQNNLYHSIDLPEYEVKKAGLLLKYETLDSEQ